MADSKDIVNILLAAIAIIIVIWILSYLLNRLSVSARIGGSAAIGYNPTSGPTSQVAFTRQPAYIQQQQQPVYTNQPILYQQQPNYAPYQ